eukprot:GHVU01171969.1.p1 GENE.GHVU01171969.1~~GHVU01171969.1.p1  ORF type:complete len:102 (-),score=7.78 GHVU01171969.1:107-412(-)
MPRPLHQPLGDLLTTRPALIIYLDAYGPFEYQDHSSQAHLRNRMEPAFETLIPEVKSSMETTQVTMEHLNDRVTKDLAIWTTGNEEFAIGLRRNEAGHLHA